MADYTGSDRRLAYLFANGGGGGGSCKVISGYYHNGDFYEDQSYTQIITGDTECLYIDLATTSLYMFDGTNYVEVQGGGGGTSGDFACDLLFENTDFSITSGSGTVINQYTLDYSIDLYDAVCVVGYLNVNTNNDRNQAVSAFVPKAEYYINSTSSYWGFLLNGSIPTNNRRLGFAFADDTTINVVASRVEYEEPKLYRVYGLKFGSNIHTYSTTEQVVGTWIDGSAIYETTYDLGQDESVSSTAWFSTGITIADIERVINAHSSNSSGTFYPLMVSCSNSNISIEACRDNNPIAVRYLTIQYTKSTT